LNKKKILILIPTRVEMNAFTGSKPLSSQKFTIINLKKMQIRWYNDLGMYAGQAGLGKVSFAVRTQYALDHIPDVAGVICLGACGSLDDAVRTGDIIAGAQIVEHDIHKLSGESKLMFRSDRDMIAVLKKIAGTLPDIKVHFGIIAGGDENILSAERKKKLHAETGAIAAAWEGPGGAKACVCNRIPYLELRAVTDLADEDAIKDFSVNLKTAMQNLAVIAAAYAEYFALQEN